MLRTPTSQSLLRSFAKVKQARFTYSSASDKFRPALVLQQLHNTRPQTLRSIPRPTTIAMLHATKRNGERDILNEKLGANPDAVTVDSSVRRVVETSSKEAQPDGDMLGGIKADWSTIKETFSMSEVPRESLYLGLAGLLPYAATSMSTVLLSYDINYAHLHGSGLIFSPELAHQLLDFITPVQIGYGAVIISFLGAIHWGLEYAGFGGQQGYRRFMIGVAAPAIAWPTIFLPVEYALITQFLAFNFLYFADARATTRGWFPPWYSTYRFVLTFIVGASIVASLVGRGQIAESDSRLKSAVEYVKEDRDKQWTALEREERERRAALAASEDNEEEDNSEEDDRKDDEKDDAKDDEKDVAKDNKKPGAKDDEKDGAKDDDNREEGKDSESKESDKDSDKKGKDKKESK